MKKTSIIEEPVALAESTSEELLTVHEVAKKFRVDDTTVRRWINGGTLDAITLPHQHKRRAYRVKQSTIDAFLKPSVEVPLG